MAFLAIVAASDLSAPQRREAARCGPPAVLARHDHLTMLRSAGFARVEETDVTEGYLAVLHALLEWSALHEDDLRAVLGDRLFDDRERDRRVQIRGVEAGVLRRSLFVASAD